MTTSRAATIDSAGLQELLNSPAPPRILDVRTPAERDLPGVVAELTGCPAEPAMAS